MKDLTDKQRKILQYIYSVSAKTGEQPTQREVAAKFQITKEAVNHHLRLCQDKGFIRMTHRKGMIKFLKGL